MNHRRQTPVERAVCAIYDKAIEAGHHHESATRHVARNLTAKGQIMLIQEAIDGIIAKRERGRAAHNTRFRGERAS